jgi:hypothetical protein
VAGFAAGPEVVVASIAYLAGGALLMRMVARRQRKARARKLAQVDGTLAALAAEMRGEFRRGAIVMAKHPILGEIRDYGSAVVEARGLRAIVSVTGPGDEFGDDRTCIRIQRPQHRAWLVTTLRLRSPTRVDPHSDTAAAFARAYAIEPAGVTLDAARGPLMKLGAAVAELELRADELHLLAGSVRGTRYITDVFQLRTLIDELARAAQVLLSGR